MKIFVFFILLTFAACRTEHKPIQKIWGVRSIETRADIFIANYVEADNDLHYPFKFLPAPMVFKLNRSKDTLNIYCNGNGRYAIRRDRYSKTYICKSDSFPVYYRILDGYVSIQTGTKTIIVKRKYML